MKNGKNTSEFIEISNLITTFLSTRNGDSPIDHYFPQEKSSLLDIDLNFLNLLHSEFLGGDNFTLSTTKLIHSIILSNENIDLTHKAKLCQIERELMKLYLKSLKQNILDQKK